MVDLLLSMSYKSGDVWNGGEHFLYNQPFENGISKLLERVIDYIAHHSTGNARQRCKFYVKH